MSSNYDKWLAAQPHCRGLSLRMAFEGGEKAGEVRGQIDMARDTAQFAEDMAKVFQKLAKETSAAISQVDKADQLAKEA